MPRTVDQFQLGTELEVCYVEPPLGVLLAKRSKVYPWLWRDKKVGYDGGGSEFRFAPMTLPELISREKQFNVFFSKLIKAGGRFSPMRSGTHIHVALSPLSPINEAVNLIEGLVPVYRNVPEFFEKLSNRFPKGRRYVRPHEHIRADMYWCDPIPTFERRNMLNPHGAIVYKPNYKTVEWRLFGGTLL